MKCIRCGTSKRVKIYEVVPIGGGPAEIHLSLCKPCVNGIHEALRGRSITRKLKGPEPRRPKDGRPRGRG